jgi:hypothetical protein
VDPSCGRCGGRFLEPDGAGEEADERRDLRAHVNVAIEEIWRADFLLGERRNRVEIFPSEILDERVCRIEAGRRPTEAVAFDADAGSSHRPPALRVIDDGVADARERRHVGVVDAATAERVTRLELQVEGRPLPAARLGAVQEPRRDVSLVRRLVGRKTRVTVDAEQRSAGPARVGDEAGRDPHQARVQVLDEAAHRFEDVALVARPVGLEPLAGVVGGQLRQKREECGRERRGH